MTIPEGFRLGDGWVEAGAGKWLCDWCHEDAAYVNPKTIEMSCVTDAVVKAGALVPVVTDANVESEYKELLAAAEQRADRAEDKLARVANIANGSFTPMRAKRLIADILREGGA